MIKKGRSTFIITTILIIVALIFSYTLRDDYLPSDEDTTDETSDEFVKTADDFEANANYVSNNTWEYTIVGTLPNPCYAAKDSVIIAESYPEQVTLTLEITEPSTDEICSQVIQDVNITGTYQASENASFNFRVQ